VEPPGAQQLRIETVNEVQFQQTSETQTTITVDPIRTPAGSESGAGYIIASGAPGTEFTILFSDNIVLFHEVESAVQQLVYLISHGPSDEQSLSSYLTTQLLTFRLNENGEYHFWIGGRLNLTELVSGIYFPDFVLEVLYQ
jgi:hypothetical protein